MLCWHLTTRAVNVQCTPSLPLVHRSASIVNKFGHTLYDEFVIPKEKVTDYRTWVSGIRPKDISHRNAKPFEVVQKEVMELLQGKVLVGHALKNDFQALLLAHPRKMIRDTQRYKPFRKAFGGRNPGLKALCKKILGFDVQGGEHSSVEDSQVCMATKEFHYIT